MGCDIHLYVEIRNRKNKERGWYSTSFKGDFSNRTYGMFAALNNVRNHWNLKPLENRGIPDDLGNEAFHGYYKYVTENETDNEYEYSEEEAKGWVEYGYSTIKEENGNKYCSNPDWHSANWCTTKELEECYNQVFEKKEYDYIQWLALINYMKTFEEEYDVRAVFWFDN